MSDGATILSVVTVVMMSPAVLVGVILRHREKMAALRNRQEGAPAILEEMNALRREVAGLRDTTTRFDMSFDAALHRVENRLDTVEQDQATPHYDRHSTQRIPEEPVTLNRS